MWYKRLFKIIVYIFAIVGFILVAGYFAVKWGWTNTRGIIDIQSEEFLKSEKISEQEIFPWSQGKEWAVFEEAVIRDKQVLDIVEQKTSISSRLLVSILAVEQLRLFYTYRAIFEQFFAPLKVLGNQSQFSLGIMGFKKETAEKIENNLKDEKSEFYLGEEYRNLLDFKTADHNTERLERLIDEKDHYYQYLYAALYLKQIIKQWENAGFDISSRPEILATLYNIGFANSQPKVNPQAGGAAIEINGKIYSFGGLVYEIYYSNELIDEFPR